MHLGPCPGLKGFCISALTVTERDFTTAETKAQKSHADNLAKIKAEVEAEIKAKEAAKQAILDRIGLTVDELKTILG